MVLHGFSLQNIRKSRIISLYIQPHPRPFSLTKGESMMNRLTARFAMALSLLLAALLLTLT